MDVFKKADKQDEGRCIACQRKMIEYGLQLQEWKTAQIAAEEMVAKAQSDKNIALAHFELGKQKWKDFITKNGMTCVQYRDGGFTGPVANLFGVKAIPQTFTIDADGVLQDQHIGDASIEGNLKKLVARAQELQAPQKALQ